MDKTAKYLSIIAIVLSLTAIVLVLVLYFNNNQQDDLDERVQEVREMTIYNEQEARSNLVEVTDSLQDYHSCINDATKEFILCDDEVGEKYCYSTYSEKRYSCETQLRDTYWFN